PANRSMAWMRTSGWPTSLPADAATQRWLFHARCGDDLREIDVRRHPGQKMTIHDEGRSLEYADRAGEIEGRYDLVSDLGRLHVLLQPHDIEAYIFRNGEDRVVFQSASQHHHGLMEWRVFALLHGGKPGFRGDQGLRRQDREFLDYKRHAFVVLEQL